MNRYAQLHHVMERLENRYVSEWSHFSDLTETQQEQLRRIDRVIRVVRSRMTSYTVTMIGLLEMERRANNGD